MEVGKLTLSGIDVVSINNIDIEAGCNQHATLVLDSIISNDTISKCEEYISNNQSIVLKHEDTVIFAGKVMELKCLVETDGAHLIITAKNGSIDLDQEKKCKSYQDTKKTYQELVETKCSCLFNTENKVTGELIIQYLETDWTFLCRVASKCNQPIYTNMANSGMLLYWGIDKDAPAKEVDIRDLISSKDLAWQQTFSENEGIDIGSGDAISYVVESTDFVRTGEAILVNGQKMYVDRLSINTNQAELIGTYYVKSAQGLNYPKIFYPDLAGVGLQGKVLSSQGTNVTVHLDMDEEQSDDGAYQFPFSAMQAASDGSGWYYMPEPGDCVKICIPAWEESGAFAVSAVSTYDGAGDAQDKMGDTTDKYMLNPSGKEMHVTDTGVSLGAGKDTSAMDMDTDGDVNFYSQSMYTIDASEKIEIVAVGDFNIKAKESIDIKTDAKGELIFNNEGEIDQLGGQVNINAEEE